MQPKVLYSKDKMKKQIPEALAGRNPQKETVSFEDAFIIRDGIIISKRTDRYEFTNEGIKRR
jgi:hypothetical protein